MVPALGIAASLLSDVGYKAMKGLVSGKSSGNAGLSLPASLTGATDQTGQNLPAKTSRTDLSSLFSKVDKDGDGSLSKQEFLDFKSQIDQTLSQLLKTQESAGQSLVSSLGSSAEKIFSTLDKDGDGKISANEFAQALQRHHHRGSTDQASAAAGSPPSTGEDTGKGPTTPAEFLNALLNLQASA